MNFSLHALNFRRIPLTGTLIQRQMNVRAAEIKHLTSDLRDPDVTILIRSKNDGAYVKQWFEDIRAQDYDGDIEVIVIDTESTDETVTYAQSQGATVLNLRQKDFTYPVALNMGFEAARNPYVVTLVGHSNLTNRMMLKSLTYWSQNESFGGMYSYPIANANGSIWDRLGSTLHIGFLCRPQVVKKSIPGMLGANTSIVKREVWQRLGGYDERFAGGGEDTELGRTMLKHGLLVVREPLCTVFHSHGLNFSHTVKQFLHWGQVAKAQPKTFDSAAIHSRRPDLRSKL